MKPNIQYNHSKAYSAIYHELVGENRNDEETRQSVKEMKRAIDSFLMDWLLAPDEVY